MCWGKSLDSQCNGKRNRGAKRKKKTLQWATVKQLQEHPSKTKYLSDFPKKKDRSHRGALLSLTCIVYIVRLMRIRTFGDRISFDLIWFTPVPGSFSLRHIFSGGPDRSRLDKLLPLEICSWHVPISHQWAFDVRFIENCHKLMLVR